MLRETEQAASKTFIWSDENMFTVEGVTIKQINSNSSKNHKQKNSFTKPFA